MSERSELIEQLDGLRRQKERLAHEAAVLERQCAAIRESDPLDPRIPGLSRQIDDRDEEHDRVSCRIGPLHSRLWEIEQDIGLHELLADIAYGRSR